MKKIFLAILSLSFALLTACSSTPSPLVKPDFALTPRVKLDVAVVSVVDRSGLPTADSTPESKEFKAMILAAVRKWAASNVVPVGTFGEAIVVIRDASLKTQSLAARDDDWFTRAQTSKYIGHVELEVNVSGVDNLREMATAQAVRYETLPEAPTVDERLASYYRIVQGLNNDLDTNLGAAMREKLVSFVLPGDSRIAEGTGKQNVMQAYPTGGQPGPVPGMPYQPVKPVGGKPYPALTVTPPAQDQMAAWTTQYDATYVPVPSDETEPSRKVGSKAAKSVASGRRSALPYAAAAARTGKPGYRSDAQPHSLGVLTGAVDTSAVESPAMDSPAMDSPVAIGHGAVATARSERSDARPLASSQIASSRMDIAEEGRSASAPVYRRNEVSRGEVPVVYGIPTKLEVPAKKDLPPARLARLASGERLTGNVLDLPPPVIIQGEQPRISSQANLPNGQQPVLRARIMAERPSDIQAAPTVAGAAPSVAASSVASTFTPSVAVAPTDAAQPVSPQSASQAAAVLSGQGAETREPTFASSSASSDSSASSRTMTVVGAGGRIRTVTVPAASVPEPRLTAPRAVSPSAMSQSPSGKDQEATAMPQEMQDARDSQPSTQAAARTLTQVNAIPPVAAPVSQPSPSPQAGRAQQQQQQQQQYGAMYGAVRPAAGASSPAAIPLSARPDDGSVYPSTYPSAPPATYPNAAPPSAAPVSAQRFDESYYTPTPPPASPASPYDAVE